MVLQYDVVREFGRVLKEYVLRREGIVKRSYRAVLGYVGVVVR